MSTDHTMPPAIAAAVADAERGHRPHEWSRVAHDLAAVVRSHFLAEHGKEILEPTTPLERIVYWGQHILDNDGRLSAGSSADLDYAQDEFEKAVLSSGAVDSLRRQIPKSIEQMQAEVTAWCERKGWKGEDSAPVTFGDTMALLHSEVSEALEAYRDWGLDDATGTKVALPYSLVAEVGSQRAQELITSQPDYMPKPEGVGSEFADVLIRLLDDCDRWGVDLRFEFERKMAYNEKRPYQHGGRTL